MATDQKEITTVTNESKSSGSTNSTNQITSNKRKVYSYEEKLKIVNLLGIKSKQEIRKEYSLDISILNKWIKKRAQIEKMCKNDYLKTMKKKRSSISDELEEDLYLWFLLARAQNFPVSGPILQTKAIEISKNLGINEFKASDCWLSSWKRRKGVRLLTDCDEQLSADISKAKRILNDLEEIFKCDQRT